MATGKMSSAKQISITAMVAAVYAVLFFGSAPGMLPGFTLLYLPVILLGVFPAWFGWSGLVGSIIGAYIGGVYVEGVAPYAAWAESVTALIIYGLNWLFISRKLADVQTRKDLVMVSVIYAATLFMGTAYILWQYTYLFNVGVMAFSVLSGYSFWIVLAATFGLNLIIQLAVCPVLLRTITPKLRSWGIGKIDFKQWLANRKEHP